MIQVAEFSDVQTAMPDVSLEHLPNVQEYNRWRNWVRWNDGCDPEGNFIGWCPLHDRKRNADIGLATYNFLRGSFSCMNAPSCHEGRRGMTLVNLLGACADIYLNPYG